MYIVPVDRIHQSIHPSIHPCIRPSIHHPFNICMYIHNVGPYRHHIIQITRGYSNNPSTRFHAWGGETCRVKTGNGGQGRGVVASGQYCTEFLVFRGKHARPDGKHPMKSCWVPQGIGLLRKLPASRANTKNSGQHYPDAGLVPKYPSRRYRSNNLLSLPQGCRAGSLAARRKREIKILIGRVDLEVGVEAQLQIEL